MCETVVCFYEYHFESLYDPLSFYLRIERISVGVVSGGVTFIIIILTTFNLQLKYNSI